MSPFAPRKAFFGGAKDDVDRAIGLSGGKDRRTFTVSSPLSSRPIRSKGTTHDHHRSRQISAPRPRGSEALGRDVRTDQVSDRRAGRGGRRSAPRRDSRRQAALSREDRRVLLRDRRGGNDDP